MAKTISERRQSENALREEVSRLFQTQVKSTTDDRQLDDWLDRVLTARSLDELEILTNNQ